MTKDVFISFASKDQTVANATCKAIEDRGYSCWISSRDVRPGRDYAEEITDAIEECKLMVFVFSQNSNNSDEVKREITLASQNGRIVIPLLTEDIKISPSFRYHLATRNWIDCSQGWEESLKILYDQLDQIISDENKKLATGSRNTRGFVADAINDQTKIPLKGAGAKAKLKGSRAGVVVSDESAAPAPVAMAEVLAQPVMPQPKPPVNPAVSDAPRTEINYRKWVPILAGVAIPIFALYLIFGVFGKGGGNASSAEGGQGNAKEYAKSLVGNWVETTSGVCGRDNAAISVRSQSLSWKAGAEAATEFDILAVEDGWLKLSDGVQIRKEEARLHYKFGGETGGILEYKSCP